MRKVTLIGILILSVLLISGCDGGGASITGEVTYLQRIALPDDAVVTVQLQDTSRQDVAAEVLGEQVIETEGKQVPIAYEVEYNEGDIVDNHTYMMSARIEDGDGNLLFINDTAIPVITRDNPTSDVQIMTVPVGYTFLVFPADKLGEYGRGKSKLKLCASDCLLLNKETSFSNI